MDEEKLAPELKEALIDRVEAWDLVEFLGLSASEIVEAFEDKIVEHLEDVLEEYGIEGIENGTESD